MNRRKKEGCKVGRQQEADRVRKEGGTGGGESELGEGSECYTLNTLGSYQAGGETR